MDVDFPITTSPMWMLTIFLVSLALFHVLFLKITPLSTTGLKKLDYYWLSLTVIGLIGVTGSVRRQIASNYVETAAMRADSHFSLIRHQLRHLSGPAYCRRFVRSEFSPKDLDEIQKEFDAVCEFGKEALARMPDKPPADINTLKLADRPPVTDVMLQDAYKELDTVIGWYNDSKRELDELRASARFAGWEMAYFVISPMLIAIAVALRMTKVTGELFLGADPGATPDVGAGGPGR